MLLAFYDFLYEVPFFSEKKKKKESTGVKKNKAKFRFHDLDLRLSFTRARFGHARPVKVRCTYVQPGQGRIRGTPAWLSHSCRIVHAEASERANERELQYIEPGDRCSCKARAKRLHEPAQPRASSAGFGCIPHASTRETALERSAECNAQYRANTRRRDAMRCEQLRPDPSPSARDYANFYPLCSFPFLLSLLSLSLSLSLSLLLF